MLKVGITGIIGSGKSTVCKIFSLLGVAVYHADHEAKKLYEDHVIRDLVREKLGSHPFDENGNIVFPKLASIIFNDPEKVSMINQIIHPRVKEDFKEWCLDHKGQAYVLYESALFFESGFYRDYDKSIVVIAPVKLCIQRIMARDQVSEAQVMARMQYQWAPEKKASLADFTIQNDEESLLIPQVLEIHRGLVVSG